MTMRVVDAHAVLGCWERGRSRHALDRALLLHAIARPDEDPETLADRPLGARNADLLRLHEALSGDELQASVDCSDCGERLEFSLSAAALRAPALLAPPHVLVGDVQVRVPTTRDLASVAHEPDEETASRALLRRLIQRAEGESDLPVVPPDQLLRALEEADPCADLTVALTCPACAHAWSASLDVAAFVWEEVDVRARRLLDEVHVLARMYGWTEAEVLKLSSARRAAYLERALA